MIPWITVFRGLQPITGFQLEGGELAGVALGVVGLLAVGATIGGGRVFRSLAALGALAILLDAALVHGQIAAYVADPGPAGLLTQPTLGVGAAEMAIAGGLLLVASLLIPLRNDRLQPRVALRLLMAAGLLVAGWIHLLLVPEHLADSMILGLGFLASGIAQLALAGLVTWRSRGWNLTAVVALNAALIVIYAYAVLVGLPFGGGEHGEAAIGLVVGAGEPIDAFGALSKFGELASLLIAFALLGTTERNDAADQAVATESISR
ncbi:MAG: hypothetical protein ABI968_12675 [Acidobacteriota bacterium]